MSLLPSLLLALLLLACDLGMRGPPPPPPPVEDPDQAALAAHQDRMGQRILLVHHLHLPDPLAAEAVAVHLSTRALQAEATAEEGEGEAEVDAVEEVVLSEAHVHARRLELEAVAGAWGGTYEGWEVEGVH
ncbi:MAG: ribonuclease E inhibitor RraB [Alphaproteobacteria bacterium]|nr:ribonuclease E inhibitor RraB [Alphaproteobacteria bacterium]